MLDTINVHYTRTLQGAYDMGVLYVVFMIINVIIPAFVMSCKFQHHDIWTLIRTLAGICCIMLIFKECWPRIMLKFWEKFSCFALLFVLPYSSVFALCDSGGSLYGLINITISFTLLALMAGLKQFVILTSVGCILGVQSVLLVNAICPPLAPATIVIEHGWLFLCTIFTLVLLGVMFSRRGIISMEETSRSLAGSIAHEIRTPLATISMKSNIIQHTLNMFEYVQQGSKSHIYDEHMKASRASLESQQQVINKINKLINVILNNIKTHEKLNLFPEKLSIMKCTEEAVLLYPYNFPMDKQKIHIDIQLDFRFSGTKMLIIHVIYNLLKNSFKAIECAGKGEIFIWTKIEKQHNILIVKDTALGIPKRLLKNVTEKFVTYMNGSGLGLSFCKETMFAINGKMEIKSTEGESTEIRLLFPKYKKTLNKKSLPSLSKKQKFLN